MKNFLVTQRVRFSKKRGYEFFLAKDWYDYASKLKINLIPYNFIFDEKNLKKLKLSGVIFSGGNDLSLINNNFENKFRDLNEQKLLRYAIKYKLLILGICRGFQFVAKTLSKKSMIISKPKHINISHKIKIKDSYFMKKCELNVNSYHKYCLRNLNQNFKIIAQLEDNTIEIAESINKKILFFMFHPERKNKSQKKINLYLKRFLNV